MMEILNEYIRITELKNDVIGTIEAGKIDRETLDHLINEKTRLIKRIEKVKQFVADDEIGEVALKIEEIKKLDDRNIKNFREKTKNIKVILDDLKIKKKNFETYRKNL
jgi:cystathionine beta-lyase family protein involved in aluminum resistance